LVYDDHDQATKLPHGRALPDETGGDAGKRRVRSKPGAADAAVAKVRQIGELFGQGMLVTEAIHSVGISESTYYRWRSDLQSQAERGIPECAQVLRLRRLELENSRLRHAVADLIIEKQAVREGKGRNG